VDAIKDQDGCFEVLKEKCIGCGLCVSTCPEQAISLAEKPKAGICYFIELSGETDLLNSVMFN
jgi:Fe-S-cluster-containing hydrogenase component 2